LNWFREGIALGLVVTFFASSTGAASPLDVRRVSVSDDGRPGNGASLGPVLSADGRFVLFRSRASNLVPDDTNRAQDVFIRDRRLGTTVRVSVASDGSAGNGDSGGSAISADGRIVAFWSKASNLVGDDTNGRSDIYVRDRPEATTTRISVSSSGAQSNAPSRAVAISADGRVVAYRSDASNLVPGDTNGSGDIFVYDRFSRKTSRVSVGPRLRQANGRSRDPSLDAHGRLVAFRSDASNLVKRDTNRSGDIFVHDRIRGTTTRVSVDSHGNEASGCDVTGCGCDPVLSAGGRFVSFWSSASNLVLGDTNARWDVFVRDRGTGRTTRVSVTSSGSEGRGHSGEPWLSATGRYVVFASQARLALDDRNSQWDVFVHDRRTGRTTAVTSDDVQSNGLSTDPVVSADGRYVAFHSRASNLVSRDANHAADVFVRHR
jgi:Tol biopolymer transport system component